MMRTILVRKQSVLLRLIQVWVISCLLVATGCEGRDERATRGDRPTVRVETTRVETQQVPLIVEAIGSVQPWIKVSPGTKIMGRIDRVAVREGDRVDKGQLLAALEKRDLEAAVEQSRAAVSLAEAILENARSQYRRMTELHGRGSVTDKRLEDATSDFRVAEARLAQAQAAFAAADVMLGYAEILSPVSGWVTSMRVEEGDMALPGMALFTVEDTSKVKIIVQLPESEVVGLAGGNPARVHVDVLDRDWDAAVDRVLPAGDPMSRTFQVEFVLFNPGGELKSGMFARALLDRGSREAVAVSEAAIVSRGQLRGVFVIDERSTARLRWVRLGLSRDGRVEVISGLGAGEWIVSAPPPGFADGTPLETR